MQAAVLARLAAELSGVEDAVHAANHQEILRCGGIAPLVRLLRHGSDGAKRHAAAALTQLACSVASSESPRGGAAEAAGAADSASQNALASDATAGSSDGAASATRAAVAAPALVSSKDARELMQSAMAQAGAIGALVDWLVDPSLGRPELVVKPPMLQRDLQDSHTCAPLQIQKIANVLRLFSDCYVLI